MLDPAPTSADLSQLELAADIKAGLDAIRRLLLESPSEFSLLTAGSALDQVSFSLIALNAGLQDASFELSPNLKQELLEMQSLSARVQALYRQASSFYSGLAAESIKNGTWDAASYSPDGDWANPASQHGRRVEAEG